VSSLQQTASICRFNEIVDAYRYMEENWAKGKLVVWLDGS
jgi:hypothetical protein